MKTHAPAATSMKVAGTLPTYRGPLGRFLAKQAEVQQARQAAATLANMRANVLSLVEEDQFTPTERARTLASVGTCACVAQLQRWFRNVYRVLNERRNSLISCNADKSFSHLLVQA